MLPRLHTPLVSRCFATDFRDVWFQSNPFSPHLLHRHEEARHSIVLATEFANATIGGSNWNAHWIESCWGSAFLSSITTASIVCSGTIMATPLGLEVLRDAMLSEMAVTATLSGCDARDQGHLNYLYYAGKLASRGVRVEAEPRGFGIVNTVGYITRHRTGKRITAFCDPKTGQVLNNDGTVSAVVHQFDRHQVLVVAARKQTLAALQLLGMNNLGA